MKKGNGKSNRKNEVKKKCSVHKRKAQEEMLGFILIVVLIVVIGVVFLFLAKPKIKLEKNIQIDNLLYSIMEYTVNNKQMKEVIKECYEEGDESRCIELKRSIEDMLNVMIAKSGMVIGKQLVGYSLNITNSEPVLAIREGSLTGNMFSSYHVILAEPKDILVKLRFYY